MEFNFKKFFIWVFIIFGSGIYIYQHYTLKDVLDYSNKHQDWTWGPKVDYYIGVGYYMKEMYPEAAAAFDQVLTNYPTCQYAPYALYRAGSSYQNINQFEKAREEFQKYMEQYPQGPEIEMVNKKYEFIKFK